MRITTSCAVQCVIEIIGDFNNRNRKQHRDYSLSSRGTTGFYLMLSAEASGKQNYTALDLLKPSNSRDKMAEDIWQALAKVNGGDVRQG